MVKTIFVDTETTGLDERKAGIIQIALILDIDGEEAGRLDLSMHPFEGAEISEDALKVSGNTLESIKAFQPEAEAFARLVEWLDYTEGLYPGKAWFGGYNVPFDRRFVVELFRRNGRALGGETGYFTFGKEAEFDCLEIARCRIPKTKVPNHKLGTIAAFVLGADRLAELTKETGLHNAMTDIVVTRELWLEFTYPEDPDCKRVRQSYEAEAAKKAGA